MYIMHVFPNYYNHIHVHFVTGHYKLSYIWKFMQEAIILTFSHVLVSLYLLPILSMIMSVTPLYKHVMYNICAHYSPQTLFETNFIFHKESTCIQWTHKYLCFCLTHCTTSVRHLAFDHHLIYVVISDQYR